MRFPADFNALQLCKRDADRSVCQQPLAVRDLDMVTKKQELRSGNIQFFYRTLFHFSSPLSENAVNLSHGYKYINPFSRDLQRF